MKTHRQRRRASGMVRVEVQAPAGDAPMLKQLAAQLREGGAGADAMRERLRAIVAPPPRLSLLDAFGAALPDDDDFDSILEGVRGRDTMRDVDL